MKKIFVLTGEPSGDKLASTAISKLQKDFEVNLIDHEVIKEDVRFNLPKILR